MQYLITEDEMKAHRETVNALECEKGKLIGELAEAKGVGRCPAVDALRACGYACFECPMEERCNYSGKHYYLPK